jgi:hypothetical protein
VRDALGGNNGSTIYNWSGASGDPYLNGGAYYSFLSPVNWISYGGPDLAFRTYLVGEGCAPNKTVECGSLWDFDTPIALDACCGNNVAVAVLSDVNSGSAYPRIYTRTWQATDCHGNSATCSQTVTVVDTTPPVLSCNVATPLLPPGNLTVLINVGLSFTATDACSPPVTTHVSVYSDEPIGLTTPDATYIGGTLKLRAERAGSGDGRVYLIVVTARDALGNSTFCCKTVVVPKSLGSADTASVNFQAINARAMCTATGSPLTPQLILSW